MDFSEFQQFLSLAGANSKAKGRSLEPVTSLCSNWAALVQGTGLLHSLEQRQQSVLNRGR